MKVIAGIGIGLLYKFYYDGGDTFTFFYESVKLSSLFREDISAFFQFVFYNEGVIDQEMIYLGQPRALFFVKLLSFVNLITYDNYWLSSVFFSLFSFAGLLAFSRRLIALYPGREMAVLVSLLFFPSVVFWSSGIIKESVAVGAIGFLASSFLGYFFIQKKITLQGLILDALMVFLLWNSKYYYAGLLLLFMASSGVTVGMIRKFSVLSKPVSYQIVLYFLVSVALLFAVSTLHPNFYLHRIPEVVLANYEAFIAGSAYEDVIHFADLSADWASIFLHSPQALVSGLFRPFVGESLQFVKILAGLENLIVLVLCITAFFQLPKQLTTRKRIILIGAIAYCIALSVFLALSAPNLGTLVRYKVGFLPVLLLIVTMNNPLIEKLNKLIK